MKCPAESPQIDRDKSGIDAVPVGGDGDEILIRAPSGAAQRSAHILNRGMEVLDGLFVWGVRPEGFERGVSGDAVGIERQVGEQLAGFTAQASGELLPVDDYGWRAKDTDLRAFLARRFCLRRWHLHGRFFGGMLRCG